jgi:hypothetical protein
MLGSVATIVYQATPRDPLLLAGVILLMSLLGLLATWIPGATRSVGRSVKTAARGLNRFFVQDRCRGFFPLRAASFQASRTCISSASSPI